MVDGMSDELRSLAKPRPKNPTWRPRNLDYEWNISTIAEALNIHRDTVRRKLRQAGIAPSGQVHNSPVYRLAEAMPAIFGAAL